MAKDLIRVMQLLFPAGTDAPSVHWRPPADIYRTRRGWLVKFDLAGVRPEDISWTVQGRDLTVRGIRRDWLVSEDCSCYVMEIQYSHFERTLTLPADVERARVAVDFRDGMLLLDIETEEASP